MSILGVFIVVNGLYFSNLIPPLPLSLKDGDIYHSLVVNSPGNYTVTDEADNASGLASVDFLARFFSLSQTVHVMPGDPLYAYTAVFSPTSLNTNVIHEWQYYDATSSAWVTRGRILLPVIGGRDGGYRTFSEETVVTAGAWRVDVETPSGQIIDRLRFNVVVQNAEPALETETIN